MGDPKIRVESTNNKRIILHFDYDCFYASCIAAQNPELKTLPLGVKQKSILATCNYAARSRGVNKLMLISEAKKVCPDLVIVNGEDLTLFRDTSKKLYSFLRSYSWNKRVERLGLDEVFLDVTDIVEYNLQVLNPHALTDSFFHLSRQDPEMGFNFDATVVSGCVYPPMSTEEWTERGLASRLAVMRLLLASHLAMHLRAEVEQVYDLTISCGISTNKLLSKLVGSKNKPRNQTTLLEVKDSDVLAFMDSHKLRKVPGIGFKTTQLLESFILSKPSLGSAHTTECTLTVGDVRLRPGMTPTTVAQILRGPGLERDLGEKVWHLLHGVDNTDVKEAVDIPTQISIEDTYKGLNTISEVARELHTLGLSLIRRMHVDLLDHDMQPSTSQPQRWIARPRTIRLSTRCHHRAREGTKAPDQQWPSRVSRSQNLPSFVFSLKDDAEYLVARLVSDTLTPLFRRLHPDKQGWNLCLINICVSNMVMSGNDEGTGNGRDISVMFRNQDEVLRAFTVYDPPPPEAPDDEGSAALASGQEDLEDTELQYWDDEIAAEECGRCGHAIPIFAVNAHQRYHLLGD